MSSTAFTRRRVTAGIVSVAAVTVLAACSSSGGGSSAGSAAPAGATKDLTSVKFVFDWIPTTGDVPVLAAQKFGWFADEGIKVSTKAGGPDVSGSTLVSAGQEDIGIVPPTGVMAARANGAPIKSVALTQPSGPTGLICNPTIGIKADDPKTLEGHTVGVSNNANDAIESKWFAAHGVDASKVKTVQTGSDLALMFAGKVDCQPNFMTLVPLQVAAHYKKDAVVFDTSSVGAVGQSIVTNDSFLAKHEAAVQGFLTAYAKGMQWALKNVDAAASLVADTYSSYTVAEAKQELPLLQKFWTNDQSATKGLLYFDQSSLQTTYDVIKGTQWLPKDVALTDTFSTAALPSPAVLP
jgi:NitT/TauT family transport system substrate-binding protein